jgi:DNA-binding transcriptional regulator YhcF (GntR family)
MPLRETENVGFDNSAPIYRQIILILSRMFARGDILPGERVASIRDMAALLKVNTNTVQRVYQELEREGLIVAKRGTGYFFSEDELVKNKTKQALARQSLRKFAEEMRALGCEDAEILRELTAYLKGDDSNGSFA